MIQFDGRSVLFRVLGLAVSGAAFCACSIGVVLVDTPPLESMRAATQGEQYAHAASRDIAVPPSAQLTNDPPSDSITSADGNVTIGVSRRYGGAISFYRDTRIGNPIENGNIVDNTQAGALFTTAIWTVDAPHVPLCYDLQKVNGVCPNGGNGLENPTQGGFLGDGWVGNINPTTVEVSNNVIHTTWRFMNYNYAFSPPPPFTDANADGWQTYFWGEMWISFHPVLPDVVVIDTKITYCKDLDQRCATTPVVTQDNQLSTLFTTNNTSNSVKPLGSFAQSAYFSDDANGYSIVKSDLARSTQNDDSENWVAALQNSRKGVGLSINNYKSTLPSHGGYDISSRSLAAIEPDLSRFENRGVSPSDPVRFKLQPGGWYEFRTYAATGDLNDIRYDLARAQDRNYGVNPAVPVDLSVVGYQDFTSCAFVGGWATNQQDASRKVTVRVDVAPDGVGDRSHIFSVTGVAQFVRPDLAGACPTDGACAYGISISGLPETFANRKLRIEAYGIGPHGENLLNPGAQATLVGPCAVASAGTAGQ